MGFQHKLVSIIPYCFWIISMIYGPPLYVLSNVETIGSKICPDVPVVGFLDTCLQVIQNSIHIDENHSRS